MDLHQDIKRVLITEEEIKQRIEELAPQILSSFDDQPMLVITLLKGGLVFTADLFRRLPVRLDIECLNVASYHGTMSSSGEVQFLDQHFPEVRGRHILLVDDILDTGRTLNAVSKALVERGAISVRTCVLLAKEKTRAVAQEADFIGFCIEDEFVVGYGLDYNGKYRNLPYIGILAERVYS